MVSFNWSWSAVAFVRWTKWPKSSSSSSSRQYAVLAGRHAGTSLPSSEPVHRAVPILYGLRASSICTASSPKASSIRSLQLPRNGSDTSVPLLSHSYASTAAATAAKKGPRRSERSGSHAGSRAPTPKSPSSARSNHHRHQQQQRQHVYAGRQRSKEQLKQANPAATAAAAATQPAAAPAKKVKAEKQPKVHRDSAMFKANPRLLTAYISSRRTPQGLLLMLQENKDHLNSMHISAALKTLVLVAKATGGAAAAVHQRAGSGKAVQNRGYEQGAVPASGTHPRGLWPTTGYNRSSNSCSSSKGVMTSELSHSSNSNKVISSQGVGMGASPSAAAGSRKWPADARKPTMPSGSGVVVAVEQDSSARASCLACMALLEDWLQQHAAAARVRDMALAAWACYEVSLGWRLL